MSLAQARALCPTLTPADHDPARDAKALESLARWLTRFSPRIQCITGFQPVSSKEKRAPISPVTGILLDATGTRRLFGPPQNLLAQLSTALANLGLPARLAIAPTPGAAWALTYADHPLVVEHTDDLPTTLAPLPPVALRLDDAALTTLHHLGLHTVGQVVALPRDLLPARFGPDLLRRIDQALGHLAEPLTPLPWHAPIEAAIDFDGIVESLEALWLAFQDLIAQTATHLTRQGLGARQLSITFRRPYADAIERTIELSSPTRNPQTLFNLIRCTMETVGEAKATKRRRHEATKGSKAHHLFTLRRSVATSLRRYEHYEPRGFTGLRLTIPVAERLTEEQIFLLEQEDHLAHQEFDRLTERLRIRLGPEALRPVQSVESHIPERAYKVEERVQDSGSRVQKKTKSPSSELGTRNSEPSPRPLPLLPTPREVRVMVRPSEDRDGAPVSFQCEGQSHRIVHAVGPERIAGAWWTGHDKTRDYFDVEDESGRRWWVFRVLETSKWYLHGNFE
jgi:protein ImuB